MKKLLTLLLLSFSIVQTHATRYIWGKNVVITSPVYEDLYVSGGTVTIRATVHGDLLVAGGTVIIEDSVTNDLAVVGGRVTINGQVGDDVRCAGGELYVTGIIGGDLVITGGRMGIGRDAHVLGSVGGSGGTMTIDGLIRGPVSLTGGDITINGRLYDRLDARGSRVSVNGQVLGNATLAARRIRLGSDAAFYKNIRYWDGRGKLDFTHHQKEGTAVYDSTLKTEKGAWYLLGAASVWTMLWYLSTVFAVMLTLEYFFGRHLDLAGNNLERKPGRSLLAGLLFLCAIPLVAALLIATIIGLPFGILVLFGYAVQLILLTIITALVLTHWYRARFGYRESYWRTCGTALALFSVLKIISYTPLMGWLLVGLIATASLGAVIRTIHWRLRPYSIA